VCVHVQSNLSLKVIKIPFTDVLFVSSRSRPFFVFDPGLKLKFLASRQQIDHVEATFGHHDAVHGGSHDAQQNLAVG
jgi:hypothetical protein